MKGSTYWAAAFVILLGAPALAVNVPPSPAQTKTTPHHRREILDQLQLTDAQRQQIADFRASYRKKMAELNGQLKVKQVELENELDKAAPDQDKVTELTQQIGSLLGQRLLEKAMANITVEKQILTPQQADQLKALQPDGPVSSGDNF
ncbi:MAG TPA: Spy/CpxP family protein refolding chaperone [bacterium]|nr:Spy/CpxP family protein refolding chaperone [bacterium]